MKHILKLTIFALVGAIAFQFAGIPGVLAYGGYKLYSEKLAPKVTVQGALFSSIDFTALADYAGDYEQGLFSTMINSMDIANDIRVVPNVKNKRNLTKLKAIANAKPFSTVEEYAGNLGYTPRVLEVKSGKSEFLIDLQEYEDEWMAAQLGPGSHANKTQIPFAQYTWNEVMKSLGAELNDRTAYFGFDSSSVDPYLNANHPYAAGDVVTEETNGVTNYYQATAATSSGENPSGTPGKWKKVNAEAIAKGFSAILDEEIAGSNLAQEAIGSISTGAEALAGQRELFRSHHEAYKKMGLIIYQSYTDYELLMDGIEDKITKYTKDDNTPIYLPGTNRKCMVKPVTWLTGSRRLIATPMQNMILATDLLSDVNEIKILEKSKLWTMPVGIKFKIGFQFQDLEALRISDQP
ncbi:MAG: hypothetical protein AAF363_18740 [Bacteroidota bacterium]